MYRFFISSEAVTDGALAITGEDVNHAKNVLRMRVGEELEAVDEDRFFYHCRILELTEEEIRCEILKKEEPDSELASSVTLFMGLPKGDKFALILQKAVELGVSEVVPVLTKRTVSRPEPKKAESKRKRWQAIAEAAAKQSKRAVIPEVGGLVSFAEALKRAGEFDVLLIPYEQETDISRTRSLLREIPAGSRIGVFIGPEGGFEPSEVKAAQDMGARSLTLGRRILRAETAAIVTLGILMYELEEA